MSTIYSPNKNYSGISASIEFKDGIGYTENKNLIEWFKSKGYVVEDIKEKGIKKK